jgi:hypothetical protein
MHIALTLSVGLSVSRYGLIRSRVGISCHCWSWHLTAARVRACARLCLAYHDSVARLQRLGALLVRCHVLPVVLQLAGVGATGPAST